MPSLELRDAMRNDSLSHSSPVMTRVAVRLCVIIMSTILIVSKELSLKTSKNEDIGMGKWRVPA